MDQENNGLGELTAEESAYFANGGEGEIAPAEPAPAEPAPTDTEIPADEGGKTAAQPKQPQTVPLAVLLEERNARKRYEADLAEERRQRGVLEQRTNLILERFAPKPEQPKVEEPKIPPIEVDPIGHFKATIAEMQKKVDGVGQATTQQQMERQQQEQRAAVISSLQSTAVAMETEFKKVTPDYDAAAAYLRQTEEGELAAHGYTAPEIQNFIQQKLIGVAARAIQTNKNPAEILYAAAKARGYAPKPAAQPNGNGQQLSEAERLANIGRAQEQNRSLSNGRGRGPQPMTAARLAEMSDAEFAKAMETPEGRALMGE